MRRALSNAVIYAIVALLAVSSFAQDRSGWRTASDIGEGGRGGIAGTVVDIDEGRNRLQIEADEDRSRVFVETDALTTQFNGFGGLIAGKPEIFIGSRGFSNVRVGDRLDVRGVGRGRGTVVADTVTLLGRTVAAPQVGVGETRSPGNVATPVDDRTTGVFGDEAAGGTAEGTVRQINAEQGRIVIQTPQRRMITIRTTRNTPVWYRGQQYRVPSLEVGDRIRVEADPRTAQADDIQARRIDVVQSVQETPGVTQAGVVALLSGRVTRIDPTLDTVYLDTGRETEIRVDMGAASDALGDRISARDLRVNDRIEISGNYNRTGDLFVATTVRYASGTETTRPTPAGPIGGGADEFGRFSVVTITGTITETLEDAGTLGVRDRDTNRVMRIWATEDLVTRLRGNGYSTAAGLRLNDSVVIKAYRDAAGNLIAQSVRLRNR